MARFSFGDAFGAGFGLIARKPGAVLAWGLMYFLVVAVPEGLSLAIAGPELLAILNSIPDSGSSGPDPQVFEALSNKLNSMQGISLLTALISAALLHAAIFRAILEPQNKGLFYLRFGMEEVWQGLLVICLYILFVLIVLAVVLVGVLVGGIGYGIGQAMGSPWGGFVTGLFITIAVLAAFAVILWIAVRFSLAAPATFSTKSFQLFESWTLTKGNAWSLFGLALVLSLVLFLIQIVIGLVALGVFLGVGLNIDWSNPSGLEEFFKRPAEEWVGPLLPWVIAISVIGSFLTAAMRVIMLAPLAEAYRQISGAAHPEREF